MRSIRKQRRLVGLYLLAQGAAAGAWWIVLLRWPDGRDSFLSPDVQQSFLREFWLADVALVVLGSLYAGAMIATSRRKGGTTVLLLCGAVWYATLVTIGMWGNGSATGLSAAMMTASAIATTWCATLVTKRP